MTQPYTMIGPNADRPLIEQIEHSRYSAQTIPADFLPLPPIERPDPVGNLLGAPKPPSGTEAMGTITKMLLDVEQSTERDALIREWFALSARVQKFLAEAKDKHKADLKRQIAELTPQCRASLDRLNALRNEGAGMESRMHALQERYGAANLKLRVATASKPDEETFPTEEELAEWRASVAKARSGVEREAGPRAALQQLIDRNLMERRGEAARLTELKQRRAALRDELEGRTRKGPFGLTIPAV
jgi:hypothetical protein